jgi:hypothetical protein
MFQRTVRVECAGDPSCSRGSSFPSVSRSPRNHELTRKRGIAPHSTGELRRRSQICGFSVRGKLALWQQQTQPVMHGKEPFVAMVQESELQSLGDYQSRMGRAYDSPMYTACIQALASCSLINPVP